jgi:hypothetical protein
MRDKFREKVRFIKKYSANSLVNTPLAAKLKLKLKLDAHNDTKARARSTDAYFEGRGRCTRATGQE